MTPTLNRKDKTNPYVWCCVYCKTETPVGSDVCDKCLEEHTVMSQKTEIALGSVTYSRRVVRRGPTGIILGGRGHLGSHSIACEHMPEPLRDQLREFVFNVELAYEPALDYDGGLSDKANG